MLLGPASIKAVRRMLIKLTPLEGPALPEQRPFRAQKVDYCSQPFFSLLQVLVLRRCPKDIVSW